MLIPAPPTPGLLDHISPTLYETLLGCPARATWSAHGRHAELASHPSLLLGICFHRVMEAAQRGHISGSEVESRSGARELFDRLAADIHASAHPLLKAKFPSPQKLPYYNLFRERAAVLASESRGRVDEGRRLTEGEQLAVAEQRFSSSDEVIVGRPDLIDHSRSEVLDYESSFVGGDGWSVSEREARRLRLYVYLAGEAGIAVSRGTIVRGNGETATVEITPAVAEAEAQNARKILANYNTSVASSTFYDLARPAPENCQGCPCLPMCEPFWRDSRLSWLEGCGLHIEGTVVGVEYATVQATPIVSLRVDASRGTIGEASISIEQVPIAWVTADGDRAPEVGDVVRVVDARLVNREEPVVVRVDRVMTALWRVVAGD